MPLPRQGLLAVLAGLAVAATLLLGGSGCKSTPEDPGGGIASVTITNHAPAEIRQATVAVFTAEGYSAVTDGSSGLVFERKGSGMTQLMYGEFVGGPVWMRVSTELVREGPAVYRLQCEAFRVEDYGDRLMEKEHPIPKRRAGPYQKLLDKVKQRLQ